MTNYTLPDESHPFDGSMLDALIDQSVPVKSALTELINKCWYTDELVAVHMQVPANLELYQEYVLANLGESFEVISIDSHVLTSTEELLRTIVHEIYQGETPAGESLLDLLHQHVDELAETSIELLIQINSAHELSVDVLRDLAEIVRNHDTMVTPHFVFWADKESEEAFQSSFGTSEATVGLIEVPGFAPREIADYLKLVFRKFDEPFPFTREDVQKIIRRSRGSGFEIDRLVSQALYPRQPEEEDQRLQGGFPVLQSMVAVALIALIAMVFFLQRDDQSENMTSLADSGDTRRIIVDIPGAQGNATSPTGNAVASNTGAEVVATGDAIAEREERRVMVSETAEPAVNPQQPGNDRNATARITETRIPEAETTEATGVNTTTEEPEESSVEVAEITQTPDATPAIEEQQAQVAAQPNVRPAEAPARQAVQQAPGSISSRTAAGAGYAAQLQRLLAHPDSNAFIQLYGTYEEANARKFVQDYAINDRFYYFKTDLNGRNWYVVVYGGFVSERAAINERDTLSAKLSEGGPWIRGMSNIRASIKP